MSSKQITIIPFNGYANNWNMWKVRYRAHVKVIGLIEILYRTVKVKKDKPSGNSYSDLKIRQQNDEIYSDLVLRITYEVILDE